MESVVTSGTGTSCQLDDDMPVAGKQVLLQVNMTYGSVVTHHILQPQYGQDMMKISHYQVIRHSMKECGQRLLAKLIK